MGFLQITGRKKAVW